MEFFNGSKSVKSPILMAENAWQIIAVSKAAGVATPRFHAYSLNAGSWSHQNAVPSPSETTLGDAASTPGGSVHLGLWKASNPHQYYEGDVATAALFDRALADSEVESLAGSYSSWLVHDPGGMWILNQVHTTHPVLDETGGQADELFESTAGTSVVAGGSPMSGDPDDTIFEGDFSTGDPSQWEAAQKSGLTANFEVSTSSPPLGESYFGRFELSTGDIRSEVAAGPRLFSGEDVYFRFKARLGEEFPAEEGEDGWAQLIWQLHHQGTTGSPPVALHIAGTGTGFFGLRASSGAFWWEGPQIDNEWHEFVIRVNHSTNKDIGFVELWMDGDQQTMVNGKARYYTPTLFDTYNYSKIGYYRDDDMVGSGTVEIASFKISRSL